MMLSEGQFAGQGDARDLKMHGDKYVLHHTTGNLIHAYPVTRDANGLVVHPSNARKRPVGSFSWFGGKPTEEDLNSPSNTAPGRIHKVIVKSAHQRKGIATAMLQYAREEHPDSHIRHSYNALSDDAKAWSKEVP